MLIFLQEMQKDFKEAVDILVKHRLENLERHNEELNKNLSKINDLYQTADDVLTVRI